MWKRLGLYLLDMFDPSYKQVCDVPDNRCWDRTHDEDTGVAGTRSFCLCESGRCRGSQHWLPRSSNRNDHVTSPQFQTPTKYQLLMYSVWCILIHSEAEFADRRYRKNVQCIAHLWITLKQPFGRLLVNFGHRIIELCLCRASPHNP